MLAVLLGLGAYIYFVEFAKQEEAEEAKKLLQFDLEAVTNVALVYPDREIEIKKDDEKWHLIKPISVEADTSSVEALVKAVNTTEVSRRLEKTQEEMSLYGLNEPAVKVQLTLKDGTQLPQITIGKDTPVGHSVYVQKAGGKEILLTPQVFRLGMTKETKDLRNKTVVAFEKEEVSQIEVRRPQGPDGQTERDTLLVLRKAASGWTLDKPVSAQADAATVHTFLSSLSSMRAQDFIEEPLLPAKEFGLDPPQLSVVLTLGDEGGRKKFLSVAKNQQTKKGPSNGTLNEKTPRPCILLAIGLSAIWIKLPAIFEIRRLLTLPRLLSFGLKSSVRMERAFCSRKAKLKVRKRNGRLIQHRKARSKTVSSLSL